MTFNKENEESTVSVLHDSILSTVGKTPLVRLRKLEERYGLKSRILGKLELFNPLGSVKDRIGLAMIEDGESRGKIVPGETHLVEPTSGNTGIALAFVAACKGYRLTLVMPSSMSEERRKMLTFLGANLELTEASGGMSRAIERAAEIVETDRTSYMLRQFDNPANPRIHYETTAREIWTASGGDIDIFISGVGTGGTIMGVGRYLREVGSVAEIVAVEPKVSAVLSGGKSGAHKIQGIGAGFVPSIVDTSSFDDIHQVEEESAFELARSCSKEEGIALGISSGAALGASLERLRGISGKTAVVILPSFAERYISTKLFQDS